MLSDNPESQALEFKAEKDKKSRKSSYALTLTSTDNDARIKIRNKSFKKILSISLREVEKHEREYGFLEIILGKGINDEQKRDIIEVFSEYSQKKEKMIMYYF
jgi:NCAIR mutase (PurE)-related protein